MKKNESFFYSDCKILKNKKKCNSSIFMALKLEQKIIAHIKIFQ